MATGGKICILSFIKIDSGFQNVYGEYTQTVTS
jgi:hypothetical protein